MRAAFWRLVFSVRAVVQLAKVMWQAAVQLAMVTWWAAMQLAVKSEMKKKAG